MPHANGAGSTAVHATDALRFGYCLLHGGKWGDKQLVPADYVALCNKMSPYNPHCPYTLMFEQNSDGHVIGAPRDAFWKSGAGGFALIIVPSLDLVIYKMDGSNTIRHSPTCRSPSRVTRAMIGNRFRARRHRRQPRGR
jgi:CubicO group peptidase (beta-lactamase class C family)